MEAPSFMNTNHYAPNLLCVSKRTANTVVRFEDVGAHKTLQTYYEELNLIIAKLCNAKVAEDKDILNFLIGEMSLQECDSKFDFTDDVKMGDGHVLQVFVRDGPKVSHYISADVANCLKDVLNGNWSGFWFNGDDITSKLELLYKLTLPEQSASSLEEINFAELRKSGTLPTKPDYPLVDEEQKLEDCFAPNLVANCANRVQYAIAKSDKYDHMKFNQLLGSKSQPLSELNIERALSYLSAFADYLGIRLKEDMPLYLEKHPITIMYDAQLTKMACGAFSYSQDDVPEFDDIKQLCALKSKDTNAWLVKHGAITSMPGVFAFGTMGCSYAYNKNNVHFGENIHAIGLKRPKNSTERYNYYYRLYSVIIEVALKGKFDCLVLNGVGDGAFAKNDTEKEKNAEARLHALMDYKDQIISKQMKIVLTDYAQNFKRLKTDYYQSCIDNLSGMSYQILSGDDANLQGQVLAKAVRNSNYVGVVNASDTMQYGCHFLELLGDHTVEECIWNQMFFGVHLDAVVAAYGKDAGNYIHVKYPKSEKTELTPTRQYNVNK